MVRLGKGGRRVMLAASVVAVVTLVGGGLTANPAQADIFDLDLKVSTPYAPGSYDPTVVRVKLHDDLGVDLVDNTLAGSRAKDINRLLKKVRAKGVDRLITKDANEVSQLRAQLRGGGQDVADLNQYYRIELSSSLDSAVVAELLKRLPVVEDAYPEPKPASPTASPSLTANQKYRNAAPGGIGAIDGYSWPGAPGDGVKIFDLEYSWNTAHEDLSKARAAGATVPLGTPVDPFSDPQHGTAVIGMLSADANTFGINGSVRNATLRMVNTNTSTGYNPAGAVYLAASKAVAGDVILLEQQTYGPTGDPGELVPVEWIPDVYDAIKYATGKGINVVEAAGNGSRNLNDPIYGASFPQGKASSGAIIVGAGAGCGYQPNRSRLYFSNYGTRVNLQGWGECVTTTGYGDTYNGGPNATYTNYFSGTSSASPIVTIAVASYVGSYKKLNGVAPTPAKVLADLVATGTAQGDTTNYPGKIGPLPNLVQAQKRTDLTAPTAPSALSASLNSSRKPVLKWNASTDNVGIAWYAVFRNGTQIGSTTTALTYTDTTAALNVTYQYKIKAVDKSGKASADSNVVTIKPTPIS